MAFNINTFRQNLSGHDEIAKVDHFEVVITPQQGFRSYIISNSRLLGIDASQITRSLSLQAEQAELPGRIFNTIEPKIYGVPYRTPATTAYTDINITFISTGKFWERKFFDAWLDYIQPRDTFNFKYRDTYVCDMTIKQYSPFSTDAIYEVKLEDAYPINVAPQGLNWSDDSGHKLSVAFAYTRWSTSTTVSSGNVIDISTIGITNIASGINVLGGILPGDSSSTIVSGANQAVGDLIGGPPISDSGIVPDIKVDLPNIAPPTI
jgi:hypothetical protein